mgnify:CR=1 FL=1
MKSWLTILLTIGFIGITIFGAFTMGHASEIGHSGSIAATAQSTDCPKKEDIFGFLNFHLNVFRTFSTAIFLESIIISLLLLIALLIIFNLKVRINSYILPNLERNQTRYQFLESFLPQKRKLARWLAIHENSPTT